MIWRNVETKEYYRGGSLKTKDGTIFNPTEAVLRKHGYEEYVAPVVEPTPPTPPSELRRQAYRYEVDELSASYVGYKADAVKALKDGNEDLANEYETIAENILEQIGKKKAEIRARYPNEVTQ